MEPFIINDPLSSSQRVDFYSRSYGSNPSSYSGSNIIIGISLFEEVSIGILPLRVALSHLMAPPCLRISCFPFFLSGGAIICINFILARLSVLVSKLIYYQLLQELV